MYRILAAVAVGVLVAIGAATPAWAHSRLLRTDPADGATLTRPVATVTLTFNERVRGRFSTVVVTGPGDISYSRGAVQVVDTDVQQRVYPLRSGNYRVAWRAVSADGHPVQGEFGFTLRLSPADEPTAGPPTAAATPTRHGSGRRTSWWVLLGSVVASAGVVAVVRLRRRAGGRPRSAVQR